MENIAISDKSALFFLMHSDTPNRKKLDLLNAEPFDNYASTSLQLRAFNTEHPLFGGEPVEVFALTRNARPHSKSVVGRLLTEQPPSGSFFALREGLFIAAPELVFLRMANRVSEIELAEIGLNLCGSFYIDVQTQAIRNRSCILTSPGAIDSFLKRAWGMRGSGKAARALRWVLPGSGSPFESKMKLQFCNPLAQGSFALPFTAMNYRVSTKGLLEYSDQSEYRIELASPKLRAGMEYDGELYHQDSSKDKRRFNALKALGWDVFPIDKSVLMNPDATVRSGHQIAKALGLKLRKPKNWEAKFIELREGLALPI